MSRRNTLTAAALAFMVAGVWGAAAEAVVLSLWTFESSVPTSAGPHAAEAGVNAGIGSLASGFHTSGATVYSNPVGNGSIESFSSNNWSIGDYYEFSTSTLGYETITFSWNQTRSSTGPGVFDVEYSTDGVSFFTLLDDYAVPNVTWSSISSEATTMFGAIAGPAALDNQGTVYFRLTAQQAPSSANGTNRVDNIMIEGSAQAAVPEPTSLLLLGLGSVLGFMGRWRRR